MSDYKLGANFSDQRMIKRLAKQGHSAEVISDALHIALSCVESFAKEPESAVRGATIARSPPDMPSVEAKAPEPEPEVEVKETEDEPEVDLEE